MQFRTRKLVKPEDLNPGGSLFGGQLLRWIDEEAAIYAMCQLDNQRVTTKFMSEIDFISPARTGDVVEIGLEMVKMGITSITFRCEARVKKTLVQSSMLAQMLHYRASGHARYCPQATRLKTETMQLNILLTRILEST